MSSMVEHMLHLADDIARSRSQAFKRRAVSTAYYAAFHAAGKICANEIIGSSASGSDAYERVYRALDHSALRTTLSGELSDIGSDFVFLWAERVRADYSPPTRARYTGNDVLDIVERARALVLRLNALSPENRRALAVSLLFRTKRS